MKQLKLVLPTEEYKESVLQYIKSFIDNEEECLSFSNFETYEKWLQLINDRRNGVNLPDNRVPSTLFLVINDYNNVIGFIDLKHRLNQYLLDFGGHIGYAVKPNERGKGYATEMLSQILEYAKKMSYNRVLLTCDKPNLASAKVIEKNGGILESEVYNKKDDVIVRRYWINL